MQEVSKTMERQCAALVVFIVICFTQLQEKFGLSEASNATMIL